MQLQLFKTLWGHNGSLAQAIEQAADATFDGLEGPAPDRALEAREWQQRLQDAGLSYIAEITTAGSYIPERHASLQQHLDSFALKLEHSLRLQPRFITCLGGCDAWPEDRNLEFFQRAMQLADAAGIVVSFETHRGRAFFNPWITDRIVAALPDIKLTCDYSHWCVVCERLLDSERDLLARLAPHAYHIHARVGYEQGPQVPHPAAPEYTEHLQAHQNWWQMIWQAQYQQGRHCSTMTPEFGPDGYLQAAPFTAEPVADLWQINRWMGEQERRHFSHWRSRQQGA